MHNNAHSQAGFTLAELVVATTLMSIVLLGVYTSFHSTILHWRNGSANVGTYYDARRVFTILEHDLGGIPINEEGIDARPFFWGNTSRVELMTVIQPMNVQDDAIQRLMQVKYRLVNGALIREERALMGPLAGASGMDGRIDRDRLQLGRPFEGVVAEGVIDFRLRYIWTPRRPVNEAYEPTWVNLVENDTAEYRLPDGIVVELVLYDPAKAPGAQATRFTKTFVFNGESSPAPNRKVGDVRSGGLADVG